MQDHSTTAITAEHDPKSEQSHAPQLRRIDVVDLQKSIVSNPWIPITHRDESGVPFSALND